MDGMEEVFGPGGSKIVLLHYNLSSALGDPKLLDERLSTAFGAGAKIVERAIFKHLCRRLDLSCDDPLEFDFVQSVTRVS